MNYQIIAKKNIWLSISGTLFILFLIALFVWGFRWGIDFTGGSLLEINYTKQAPTVDNISQGLKSLNLQSLSIQPEEGAKFIVRFQETSQDVADNVLTVLDKVGKNVSKDNKVEEIQFNAVGPSIGQELKQSSVNAIFFVFLAIILYITWAFRKVSKPVSSWKYGVSAILAMFHDVVITLGVFAVLGHFLGIEINSQFVAAVLTVIGYSVHDTIVVFDRIRENLPKSNEDFAGTVNNSLNQTLVRSLNTSLTVILTLVAIVIFGGESIRTFALALAVGIFIGTYSSIFVASPILVIWEKRSRLKKA